jgi:site-specific DNA-cytosine methylase
MGLFDDLLEEDNIQTTPKRQGLFDDLLEDDDLTPSQQPAVDDYFTPRPLKTQQEEREIGTLEGISNAARNAFDSSRQAMDVVGGVTPEEAQNIAKIEFDKKSRKFAPGYDEYQKAEGMNAVLAFAKNPIEVTSNIVAEGLAGSLPALGAGLVTGGVAAAAAAPTVIGAPVAFTGGQIAGTFAGSLATEYGSKVLEELQGDGMDISDPNSIQTFFSNEELLGKAKDKALKRGVPIAAFDAISAGIGGKLGRVFGTKVITEGSKVIGKQFATKTGEALTELGVQAGLGAGGEVAGALAAGETPSIKAAFGEAIGEVGTGSIEVLQGKIADNRAMAKTREDAKIKVASELSTKLEENNAPLTANIVTTRTAANIEQDKLAAQLDEELSIQQTAAAAAQQQQTNATKEIIKPEGVREEPQDRTQGQNSEEAGVSRSLLSATRSEEERQIARDIVSELQAVSNNTATNEQIARLSMDGLVDVRRGQAIINEDGEGILAQAQAPLPKLTPEARAAEVEATPRPLPIDALPTETPGAQYGREAELFDVFGGVRRRPVDVAEPIIGEKPQTSPIVSEQVTETTPVEQVAETQIAEEPIISEKPQTSEIVGAETPTIVEQEQVATTEAQAPEVAPVRKYSIDSPEVKQAVEQTTSVQFLNRKLARVESEASAAEEAYNVAQSNLQQSDKRMANYQDYVRSEKRAKSVRDSARKEVEKVRLELSEERTRKAPFVRLELNSAAQEAAATPTPAVSETIKEPAQAAVTAQPTEFGFVKDIDSTRENIKKNLIRFASGMSGLSDMRRGSYARAGHRNYGIGFDVGLLSKNTINELANFIVNLDTQVFIDSGAFSSFKKAIKEGRTVEALDFDKILAKYDAIIDEIDKANAVEKTDYPRPMLVMPDVIGNQKASLDLIDKHKNWIATSISMDLSVPIIPIPLGELSLSDAYSSIIDILKTNTLGLEIDPNKFVVGIPSNAEAISRDKLAEFLKQSQPPRIHFLGAAADKNISPLIDVVAQNSPNTQVTADASKVRSAILNGVAKGKTRQQAIFDALYQEDDPNIVLESIGKNPEQLAPTEPETQPAPTAQPEDIAVGNRVKLGKSPQTYTIEEVIPQTATEQELGEKYYSVKNERTGEVQVVEERDLKKVGGKKVRKMAIQRSSIWEYPFQEIPSAATSINEEKLPQTFNIVKFKSGTINADIGGGRFNNATESLAEKGVENVIYDPFNRTQEWNSSATSRISGGKANTATINNVLNVIKEPENRERVIMQAADSVKQDGEAYFLIHEGDRSGNSRITKQKDGVALSWQEHKKAEAYISEIKKHFGTVVRSGNLITATNPIKEVAISYNQLPENIQKEADFVPNKESTSWKLEQVSVEDLMENSPAGMTGDISEIEGYDIDSLIKSIKKDGVKQPVVVVRNADGSIDIEGNHRVYAAYEAGLDTIPAYVLQKQDTPKQAVEEKISKTALIDKDGSIISAPDKNHAMLMEESQFNLDAGEYPPMENYGFVTNFGRFVGQKEAQEIARNSQQVIGGQQISGELVTAINEEEGANILRLNVQGASGNKFNEAGFKRFPGIAVTKTNSTTLTSHPLYNAAKNFENVKAAKIIVDELIDDQFIFDVFASIDETKPAYIVPVLKGEGDSLNMLPVALAEKLSNASGIPVWGNLIQATSEQSTGAGVNDKAEISRQFMGEAPPEGSQIIIVDDYLATGRTIASLENMSGTASAVATIALGRYGKQYGLTTKQAENLLKKANITRERFYEIYGLQPEQAITGIEAQVYLLNGAAGEGGLTSRFPVEKISPSNERIKNIANVPRAIELFGGAGLFALGVKGIVKIGYVVEADQRIAEFYEEAHGVPVIQDYVQNVKFYGINGGHLQASPVCKNFSGAKNKKQITEADIRNDKTAADAVSQAIEDTQPNTISIENVKQYKGSDSYNSIIATLERNGYIYDANVYKASDFGAPTSRERLIIRAVKKGGVLPEVKKKNKRVSWYDSLKDIVNDLPNHDIYKRKYPAKMMRALERKGIDLFNVREPLLISGMSGESMRWSNEPAFTLLASPGSLNIIALPGGIIKKVTARAMARMTGVPDSFPLPADEALAKTIIGNGIPPALTRSVIGDLIQKNQKPEVAIPKVAAEKNQYTFDAAEKEVTKFFGEMPEGIVIVNNTTDPDLQFKAGYDVKTGEIILNLAYIDKKENIGDIISHELGHYIFGDPQFRADFQEFWEMMTPEEQAEADRIINQFYNNETGETKIEEKQIRAFMQLISDSKAQPQWKQLLDSIKRWINKYLGTKFQTKDRTALAILSTAMNRFASGERIIRETESGVLRSVDTDQGNEYPSVGININDKTQDFTGQILRGEKTIETRDTNSLKASIGKRVGIVRTGKGKAVLVGYANVGEPIVYNNAEEFRADQDKHLVEENTKFDIKLGEKKYGYPLTDIEAIDPIEIPANLSNWYSARSIPQPKPSSIRRMAAEPRREKVAGKERGEIITTPEGIIKQSKAVIRNKFFDGTEVSDERTLQAWNYIEQFLDIESGASNELAGIVNDVVDQETNSKARMGAGLFHAELGNYAAKLAAQGDMTMLPYIIRRINTMRLDDRAGGLSKEARDMRARQELDIDGFNTLKTENESKVERTAATLFGTDRPSKDQVKIVQDAINAAEDETIGNPEDVAAEIEKVENRTGRRVVDKVEGKIKESTEPKKEELLISFENLDADKKIKGITLKYNPQKVNVAKNIQNFIIGKMVDYRKTLVNQGAGGLESTFWQTMSNLENKPGPLGELDQAQNNELARIVKNTLIKLGLQGEPDNTKMTDIEKVASILNENKLSDEKRLEADSRIVEEIERRRQSDLASGSSPEAVNAKYDVILDAWNEAMSRQLNMPISDNMLQRLLKSEIKQRNTQIGELINENDGRVTEQVKNDIVDSIIRRVYGVSKESETGIEMDEDYSNLQSYLKQTINNMYATAIQKKNAAYAKRQAERSLKNNVDAQAQSIINQLSTELSDTPSFSPQIENKVKVIVQQDLRQRPNMGRKQPWTSQLTAKLIDAGVNETQAQTIAELTWRQHEIKAMDRELKELQTAAEKGSLAVIVQRIKDTPLAMQQEPNWMQGVIREYLVEAGLSDKAAETAAKLYESVISEKFAEAKQKAFETTLNKSAPWQNYLSRNSRLGKDALKRIQDAIRTGVLDPTQNVESIIARENGWSGFTKEQFQRIVQLDNVISNPDTDQVTKAEAMDELNKIIVKAKIPVRFKDAIGAYYVGQALMGIPTLTVNIASPIGFSFRNLITDIGRYAFTEPSRTPMAFETFLDSMKSWYNQSSYAFRNQIYMNDVVEYLNGQNVLRELFDKGKAQWAKGEYASGMANMLVGMTQITGRVLSALDQGAISMLENQNITRYAMEAMKQRNIPQSKRKEIANMILNTRRRTYAENIAAGMEKDRAGVLADLAVRSEISNALSPEGINFNDILDSAINDSLQSVGRNKTINIDGVVQENKRLSDAGMLSYLPIEFLQKIASGAASSGPLMQVFSKMVYGFALVPARVFHTTAWYSPYGFIRLGIDAYKKNKGEDSPYAMSLQTDLQYKQRLTDAIAGSIVMLGLAALASGSTDDDEEKKFKIVITGNGPSYSADRQFFDSWNKKWKPYSIHIVMGDTIIPINIGRGGEALFFPIMLAGALDDWAIKKKLNLTKKTPEDLNFAVEALGSAFFALAQRGPYAAFTKPLFDASKEGKITEELVGQAGFFGKTFVPILGASVARNISDFINDPVDRSSLEGAIYANTPVIGPWMGAKALNALGQPVRADDWGDKLYKLGAPVVFSFPKNTPENELNELILKKGSGPSIPTRSNAQKRFGDVMTDKEFETYVREYGRVVSDKMFKNRKKLENMSVKNYDDELQRYVTGYSIDGIKISGASDMAVRAVKKMRTQ